MTLALEPYLLNQCTISTGIILNWFSRSSHWLTGQNTDFKLSFVPHTKLLHGLWRLLGYFMVPLLGMNTCSSKCLLLNKKVSTWWTFMRTIALSTHTHKKSACYFHQWGAKIKPFKTTRQHKKCRYADKYNVWLPFISVQLQILQHK